MSFSQVVDKGTTDAILCGSNSFHNVYQMNKHVSRVMKKGACALLLACDRLRRNRVISGGSVEAVQFKLLGTNNCLGLTKYPCFPAPVHLH